MSRIKIFVAAGVCLVLDDGLSQQEKRREFIRQVKKSYCFRVGKVIVKASYSGTGFP